MCDAWPVGASLTLSFARWGALLLRSRLRELRRPRVILDDAATLHWPSLSAGRLGGSLMDLLLPDLPVCEVPVAPELLVRSCPGGFIDPG